MVLEHCGDPQLIGDSARKLFPDVPENKAVIDVFLPLRT